MHRVEKIDKAQVTRFFKLKNLETQTQDVCFDDSDVFDENDFSFMKIGEEYNCKILLFGKLDESGEVFEQIGTSTIGNKIYVKLRNQKGDVYYIGKKKIPHVQKGAIVKIVYTRKDIIQVNEVLHPCLREK